MMMELREKGEEEEEREREEGSVQQTLAGQRLPSVARSRAYLTQLVIAPGTECPRISGEGDTASGLLITARAWESGRTELEAQFRIRLIMGHGYPKTRPES